MPQTIKDFKQMLDAGDLKNFLKIAQGIKEKEIAEIRKTRVSRDRTLLHFLIDECCSPESKLKDTLSQQTPKNATAIVNAIVKLSDLEAIDDEGNTALQAAIRYNAFWLVATVLQKNADVNTRNEADGSTALHLAALAGDSKILMMLLSKPNIDVNILNDFRISALHLACDMGNLEHITNLIEKGANINQSNIDGDTALHYAVNSDKCTIGIIKELIKSHITYIENNQGKTPFWSAVGQRNFIAAKELLGFELDYYSKKTGNVLSRACLEFIASNSKYERLLQKIADQKTRLDTDTNLTKREKKELSESIKNDESELEELKASIVAKRVGTMTVLKALKEALASQALQKNEYMFRNKKTGNTILHYAVSTGIKDVVSFLLEIGIDVNQRNLQRKTALEEAILLGEKMMDIIKDLLKYTIKYSDDLNNLTYLYDYVLTNTTDKFQQELLQLLGELNIPQPLKTETSTVNTENLSDTKSLTEQVGIVAEEIKQPKTEENTKEENTKTENNHVVSQPEQNQVVASATPRKSRKARLKNKKQPLAITDEAIQLSMLAQTSTVTGDDTTVDASANQPQRSSLQTTTHLQMFSSPNSPRNKFNWRQTSKEKRTCLTPWDYLSATYGSEDHSWQSGKAELDLVEIPWVDWRVTLEDTVQPQNCTNVLDEPLIGIEVKKLISLLIEHRSQLAMDEKTDPTILLCGSSVTQLLLSRTQPPVKVSRNDTDLVLVGYDMGKVSVLLAQQGYWYNWKTNSKDCSVNITHRNSTNTEGTVVKQEIEGIDFCCIKPQDLVTNIYNREYTAKAMMIDVVNNKIIGQPEWFDDLCNGRVRTNAQSAEYYQNRFIGKLRAIPLAYELRPLCADPRQQIYSETEIALMNSNNETNPNDHSLKPSKVHENIVRVFNKIGVITAFEYFEQFNLAKQILRPLPGVQNIKLPFGFARKNYDEILKNIESQDKDNNNKSDQSRETQTNKGSHTKQNSKKLIEVQKLEDKKAKKTHRFFVQSNQINEQLILELYDSWKGATDANKWFTANIAQLQRLIDATELARRSKSHIPYYKFYINFMAALVMSIPTINEVLTDNRKQYPEITMP